MKVSELIEVLQMMDKDAEVQFSYNYGDYWRTQVAASIDQVDEGMVKHSAYHEMDKLVEETDAYDDETGELAEGVKRVVLLS